jgi:hypothetical protein
MTASIDSFLGEWSAAEYAGDAGKLDSLLTEEFADIGPMGFLLPKAEWLARHQQGLSYESFGLGVTTARADGDATTISVGPHPTGYRLLQPHPRNGPSHLRPCPPRGAVAPGQRSHELHRRHPKCTTHLRHRQPATTSSGCRMSIADRHMVPRHRSSRP